MYIHFNTTLWHHLLKKPILRLSCWCTGVCFSYCIPNLALIMYALSPSLWGELQLVGHVRSIAWFLLYTPILNYSGNRFNSNLGPYAFFQNFFLQVAFSFLNLDSKFKERNVFLRLLSKHQIDTVAYVYK